MGTITFIDVLMYLDFYPPCVGAWFNPVGIYFSNNNTAPYEITVMNFNAVELDLGEPPGPYSDFDSMTFQNMTGVWKGPIVDGDYAFIAFGPPTAGAEAGSGDDWKPVLKIKLKPWSRMELPELEAWQSKLQAQKDIVSGGGSVDEKVQQLEKLLKQIKQAKDELPHSK